MKKLFTSLLGLGAAAAGAAYFFKKYNDYYESKEQDTDRPQPISGDLTLNHKERAETSEETTPSATDEETDELTARTKPLNLIDDSGLADYLTIINQALKDFPHQELTLSQQVIYFDQSLAASFQADFKALDYKITEQAGTLSLEKSYLPDLTLIQADLTQLLNRLKQDFAIDKGLKVTTSHN